MPFCTIKDCPTNLIKRTKPMKHIYEDRAITFHEISRHKVDKFEYIVNCTPQGNHLKHNKICSIHFRKRDFYRYDDKLKKRLKLDALPSLYLPQSLNPAADVVPPLNESVPDAEAPSEDVDVDYTNASRTQLSETTGLLTNALKNAGITTEDAIVIDDPLLRPDEPSITNVEDPSPVADQSVLHFCRVCMKPSDSLTMQKADDDGQMFLHFELISMCFVDLKVDSSLPYLLCANCVERIMAVYELKNSIAKAEVKFKNYQKQITWVQLEDIDDVQVEYIDSMLEDVLNDDHAYCKPSLYVDSTEQPPATPSVVDEAEPLVVVIENGRPPVEREQSSSGVKKKRAPLTVTTKPTLATIKRVQQSSLSIAVEDRPPLTLQPPSTTVSDDDAQPSAAEERSKTLELDLFTAVPLYERTFPCLFCDQKFPTFVLLDNHNGTSHPYHSLVYKCASCEMLCNTMKDMAGHELMHTGRKTFRCQMCGTEYRLQDSLKRHLQKVHHLKQPRDLFCKLSGIAYNRYLYLIRHMNRHNTTNTPKCSVCLAECNNIDEYRKHMTGHDNGDQLHACLFCSRMFYVQESLDMHAKSVHKRAALLSMLANDTKNVKLTE